MHAWGWRDTLKSLEKVICFSNPKPTPFISFTFATIHVWERRKHSRIFVNLYLFFKPKTHFIYPIHICHDPCVRVAITPSHVREFYFIFWTQKPLLTTFTFATICAWEWHDAFAYLYNSIFFLNPKTTSHRFHICHDPCVRVERHSHMYVKFCLCFKPKTQFSSPSYLPQSMHESDAMLPYDCTILFYFKTQNNFSLHSHLPRSMREKVTWHSCMSVNYYVFEPNNHFPLHSHLPRSMHESDATLWHTCFFFLKPTNHFLPLSHLPQCMCERDAIFSHVYNFVNSWATHLLPPTTPKPLTFAMSPVEPWDSRNFKV